jgi:hypothetical protein
MSFHWFGAGSRDTGYHFGSLAVVAPILQRVNLAALLDRHLPADPQAECAYGPLLSLRVAARLDHPGALVCPPGTELGRKTLPRCRAVTRKPQASPTSARGRTAHCTRTFPRCGIRTCHWEAAPNIRQAVTS